MRRLRITILDLTTEGPTKALYARLMHPNQAGIMPQAVGVWCEEAGHDVRFICYTGFEDLRAELEVETDVLFISSFTQAALLSISISALFRRNGTVTVLGGPHARAYPEDSTKYFDYVLGFTDRKLVEEVLKDAAPHRPGLQLAARKQPEQLPGVRERWRFIEPTIAKAPTIKIVPMIGSLGCPYTCSFCIDADVDYQPLSFDQIRDDLKFLKTKMKRPIVGWHDPNFGVRFDETMAAIESALPDGGVEFISESSLSILTESRLARLKKNGFKAVLPGIESWYDLGNKSKTGKNQGIDKVRQVADHVNTILRYIPYVQANFVLGLDCDEGAEPFELTKAFIDLCPGAFPGYSLLTAFGRATPLNLDLQRAGRVLPFPFQFLNNHHAMNVRPLNYRWTEFYDHLIGLTDYSFSWPRIFNRFQSNREPIPKWMNVVRAVSSEGFGRVGYHRTMRRLLETDAGIRDFHEGRTEQLPEFYVRMVKKSLGSFWEALPAGALMHNPTAYLDTMKGDGAKRVRVPALESGATATA